MTPLSSTPSDLSILVIDDDEAVRAWLTPTLGNLQLRVVLARDTVEGLERFHSACPDLVIINIDLPDA
ncbi:MAG: response regulator, partial [Pseudomonadota bacterium]